MTTPSAITLTAFIAWTLAMLIFMEVIRSVLFATSERASVLGQAHTW